MDYVPLRYSDFPRAFGPGGALSADVLLMQVPPPDAAGVVSPGLCGAIGFDIAPTVRLCIAEINDELPFTHSPVELRLDDLDVTVAVSERQPSLPRPEPWPSEVAVAENVASVIEDEATLQFGTGSVVEAVLALLGGHKGLGIHSGMVTDGILPLLEKGAIDNRHKGVFDGKTVTGMAGGSEAFRRFMDRNPDFLVVPACISHGHDVLARLRKFTTVNSAVEVDLTGQVNAEYMKGSQFSGVGGQADYTFAGSTSAMPGSKAIIAMPAATAGGAVSRVVTRLCPGAIVTTPRYCVDFVATDYGVADLRFLPLAERARRLIAVAHPAHREALEHESRRTPPLD